MEDRIFEWGSGIIAALLALLWNDNRGKIKELDTRQRDHEAFFTAHREGLSDKFVKKDEFEKKFDKIDRKLDQIDDKLEKMRGN